MVGGDVVKATAEPDFPVLTHRECDAAIGAGHHDAAVVRISGTIAGRDGV
jgi:hypothetical protein